MRVSALSVSVFRATGRARGKNFVHPPGYLIPPGTSSRRESHPTGNFATAHPRYNHNNGVIGADRCTSSNRRADMDMECVNSSKLWSRRVNLPAGCGTRVFWATENPGPRRRQAYDSREVFSCSSPAIQMIVKLGGPMAESFVGQVRLNPERPVGCGTAHVRPAMNKSVVQKSFLEGGRRSACS